MVDVIFVSEEAMMKTPLGRSAGSTSLEQQSSPRMSQGRIYAAPADP